MVPDELIGNLGDTHLYLNHIDAAKEQITREPYELPKLVINGEEPSIIEKTNYWKAVDFEIVNYKSHPSIKAPLSN
jgi:thymidylate synthase